MINVYAEIQKLAGWIKVNDYNFTADIKATILAEDYTKSLAAFTERCPELGSLVEQYLTA